MTSHQKNKTNQVSAPLRLAPYLLACVLAAIFSFIPIQPAQAEEQEPISTYGHGGFFDPNGNQIPLTLDFVEKAQGWYRDRLLVDLPEDKKQEFANYKERMEAGLKIEAQEQLIVQHQEIEWLLDNLLSDKLKFQFAGKLRALRYAMNWSLPEQADLKIAEKLEPFNLNPEIIKRLELLPIKPAGSPVAEKITTNSGRKYNEECDKVDVPIPPPINKMASAADSFGWTSQGFIPPADQFIVGTPAEVRTYTSPKGLCYALPRYSDATLSQVKFDGVICLGKQSSKTCFWDNQMNGNTFSFPSNTQIPIGEPNFSINLAGQYQAGGKEIEFNKEAGVCTDCHAGENPFIVHPKSNLAISGSPVLWETLSKPVPAGQGLPTTALNRYDPIVAASWPQNQASQAAATVPGACAGCHIKGDAGRFPHLSNQLPSYCTTVLRNAINKTMPPGSPGSASGNPGSTSDVAKVFMDTWCNAPPNPSSADTSGSPTIPPPHDKPVACSVFDDGFANESPLSEAIYFADAETACVPDGTSRGLCRRWFGNCVSTIDQAKVAFKVFNDGAASPTPLSRAIYNRAPNSVCIPGGTVGDCRRWQGEAVTENNQKVECYLFNDGLSDWIGPTSAIYYRQPGQVCMPDGTPTGACRKWFGNCQVTNQSSTEPRSLSVSVSPRTVIANRSQTFTVSAIDAVFGNAVNNGNVLLDSMITGQLGLPITTTFSAQLTPGGCHWVPAECEDTIPPRCTKPHKECDPPEWVVDPFDLRVRAPGYLDAVVPLNVEAP